MSISSAPLRLQSLPHTGHSANARSTSIVSRGSLGDPVALPSSSKRSVQTRATCTRGCSRARTFGVILLLLSPIFLSDGATDPAALLSSFVSPADWRAPSRAAGSLDSIGESPTKSDYASAHSSFEEAVKDRAPLQKLSGGNLSRLETQQESRLQGVQRRALTEKGKVRAPPLSHIHSALPEVAVETNLRFPDVETTTTGQTKNSSERAEPEVKRLGAQARSKQVTTTKGTGHEANALPLRTYVYGNIHQTAYYFADVIIGTPPVQRQSLILDTGSSVVGYPCTSCKSCGAHIDPPFDCAASSTCKRLKCTSSCTHCDSKQRRCAYRVSYMEGSSLQGFWHEDYLRVLKPPRMIMKNNQRVYDIKSQVTQAQKNTHFRPPSSSMPSTLLGSPIITNFGCHMEETALFVNQKASGIWGLEIWSQFGPPTYMTRTLLSRTSIPHQVQDSTASSRSGSSSSSVPFPSIGAAPIFALCLAEHGGAFAIGEAHNELHTSKLVKTRCIPDQESYSVYLSAIVVGEQNIPLSSLKTSGASARLPPAFVSASFETVPPFAASSASLRGPETLFEVLLDSGTTMSYFPTDMYTSIIAAMERHAEQQNEKLSSRARRLNFSSTKAPATGMAPAAEGKNRGKLLQLFVLEEHAEDDGGDAKRWSEQNEGTDIDAEGRRLGGLRGENPNLQLMERDCYRERSADETTIVRNQNTSRQSHIVNESRSGVRRALPGEAGKSVPQRRSNKNHPPSAANVMESQHPQAITQALLPEKDTLGCLHNRQDATGYQQILKTKAQPAAYLPKLYTAPLFSISSVENKRIAAKTADNDGIHPSSATIVRPGTHADGRLSKLFDPAGRLSANLATSKIQIRTEKGASVPLDNMHLGFSKRRPEMGNIREKLHLHNKARFVTVGEEVRDSEAEVVGDILSSHHVNDQTAYELLPQSASPRQSQAVKVESAEGELCFYLPKGRADLKYFPDIWIKFVQMPPHSHTSGSSAGGRKGEGAASAARTSRADAGERDSTMREASGGWLRWKPSSYLYTKGNDHYRCIALSDDPKSKTTGVLGSSFFIGHDVIFDVGNHTVAFAEASCPWIRLKDRPRELPL